VCSSDLRAHRGARAPKEAVINGARYDLKLFLDQASERFVRTFYPVYLGPAAGGPVPVPVPAPSPSPVPSPAPGPAPGPIVASPIKILAALVNPGGHDEGREKVTLINAGPVQQRLDGWFLVDKQRNRIGLEALDLEPGQAATLTLPPGSIQLSNKGGEIRLVDRSGHTAHLVSYTKTQADREGETIIF
jgi:hypothetical protein